MKKYFNISLIFTILFIVSCGDVENGEDGVDGMNTLVKNETECSLWPYFMSYLLYF